MLVNRPYSLSVWDTVSWLKISAEKQPLYKRDNILCYMWVSYLYIYISYNIPFHGNSWVRNVEGFSFIKENLCFPFVRRLNYGYHWITSSRNTLVPFLNPKPWTNGGFKPSNIWVIYFCISLITPEHEGQCGFPSYGMLTLFPATVAPPSSSRPSLSIEEWIWSSKPACASSRCARGNGTNRWDFTLVHGWGSVTPEVYNITRKPEGK